MSAAALVEQAKAAGVTLRLVDGKVKATGTKAAVTCLLEPLRQHKADLVRWFTQTPANEPEPPKDPAAWRELANAYNAHHFNCVPCQAAGRGSQYGLRCGTGTALWWAYAQADQPSVKKCDPTRNED